MRWDETWHRLREWTNGQAQSERLAAQVLVHEGFESIDPSHPLGGKDGGQDASCIKGGRHFAVGVYFPRGGKSFRAIAKKFKGDLQAVRRGNAEAFVFVTNQELRLSERSSLLAAWPDHVELLHLERVATILDTPEMVEIRRQFLDIDFSGHGVGGAGGSGTIVGNRGVVVGGRGGSGGAEGKGGDGGGGFIQGDDGLIVGGDGGSSGTADGRGGRPAVSPAERMGAPTELWRYGRGGAGANSPEYNRRLALLASIRREYMEAFPDKVTFIEAGIDIVPLNWVNKRLDELSEGWHVNLGEGGYILPSLRLKQ